MNNKDLLPCTISRGSIADVATIARFQIEMAMESEGCVLDTNLITQGVTAVMNDSNKGLYLIARVADTPVGNLMITREWSDWNNHWYWWVQSVYVLPSYRGKGIYTAMYASVKEMAAQQGVSQVRLYVDKNNTPAQNVYRKLGMNECHYYMYEDVL